jgi:predicted nucleic acid-binding protein
LELVEFPHSDFESQRTKAVENELGRDNPTSRRLQAVLVDKSIKRATARSEKIKLFGDGERAAINLALERKLLVLIDDWRPYEAAQAAGVEVVNSLAYLIELYEQKRITLERALHPLARMMRRGTLRPEWIQSALRVVAEIRRKGENR